jgi:hypothetical protein
MQYRLEGNNHALFVIFGLIPLYLGTGDFSLKFSLLLILNEKWQISTTKLTTNDENTCFM